MFCNRDFTDNGDAYNGFSAILDFMSSFLKDNFLWGLPRSRFELGFLWRNQYPQYPWTAISSLPMTAKNVKFRFPSWSWMGWKGAPDMHVSYLGIISSR
jgi:hypothetical protein